MAAVVVVAYIEVAYSFVVCCKQSFVVPVDKAAVGRLVVVAVLPVVAEPAVVGELAVVEELVAVVELVAVAGLVVVGLVVVKPVVAVFAAVLFVAVGKEVDLQIKKLLKIIIFHITTK